MGAQATCDAGADARSDPAVLGATGVLERHPSAIGIFDAVGSMVWANAAMRAGLQCDEWPRLDLRGRFDRTESELAVVSFDEFVASGIGFSMVRSFAGRRGIRRVRCTYWAVSAPSGRVQYAGVLVEPFASHVGRTLTDWLDEWPQPCALVREREGAVFFNRTARQLVGLDDSPLSPEALEHIRGSDEPLQAVEALRERPGSTTLVELSRLDGEVITVIAARAPLPPEVDPDLMLVVAHEIAARVRGIVAFPVNFSAREREVAELLLVGHRVSTIAATLFISPYTVRNHLRSMFAKSGVTSQGELVAKLRSSGHTLD